MNFIEILIIALVLVAFFVFPQIALNKLYKENVVFSVKGIPHRAVISLRVFILASITGLYLLDKLILNLNFEQYRFLNGYYFFIALAIIAIIQFYNYLVVLNQKGIRGYLWKIKWSEIEGYSIDKERGEIVIKGSRHRVIRNIKKANWQEVEKMFAENSGNAQSTLLSPSF